MSDEKSNVPEAGEQFRFYGLFRTTDPELREITVHSISTSGQVSYVIRMEGEEPSMHSAPLSEIMLMIEHMIWVRA